METQINLLSGNDELLWKRLIQGERDAFGEIYQLYVNDLFRFGCSLVQDEDLVMDYIHEIFLNLWKYHSQLQKTDKVKLYLFKCLSNMVQKEGLKDQKRKNKLEKFLIGEEFVLESIEHQLIFSIQNKNLQNKLAHAIEELPLRQKAVINCLFFEEFSYEETSKIMNINLRSVYTLAWKAISNLRVSVDLKIIFVYFMIFQ